MDDETLAQGLSQLLMLGFDENQSLYALLQSSSFEEALDVLLNSSAPVSTTNTPGYPNPQKIPLNPSFSPNPNSGKQYYVPEPIKNISISPPLPFPGQSLKPLGNQNIPTEIPISQNSNRDSVNPNQIGGFKPQIIKFPEPQTVLQNKPLQVPPILPKSQIPSVPLIPQPTVMNMPKPTVMNMPKPPVPIPIPIPIPNPGQYNPNNSSQGQIFNPTVPQMPVLKNPLSQMPFNSPIPIPAPIPIPKPSPSSGSNINLPSPYIPEFKPSESSEIPIPQIPKKINIPIPAPLDPKNPLILQSPQFTNENPQPFQEKNQLFPQISKVLTVPQVPIPKSPNEPIPVPKLNSVPISQPNKPIFSNDNTEISKPNFISNYPELGIPVPPSSINTNNPIIPVPNHPLSPPPIKSNIPMIPVSNHPLLPSNTIPIAPQIPIPSPSSDYKNPIPIPPHLKQDSSSKPGIPQGIPLKPIPNIPNIPQIPIKLPPSLPQKSPIQFIPQNPNNNNNIPLNIQKPYQNIPQIPIPIPNKPFIPQQPSIYIPPPQNIIPNYPQYPVSNYPQMPIQKNPPNQFPSYPSQEDYKEFLRNGLKIKNFPDDAIDDVVISCTSKEEALLILGIPTYYKDLPISEIPMEIDESQDTIFDEIPENDIKSQLIKDGVDLETAELLSQTCLSLEEAYHNISPQAFNTLKPPFLIPPNIKPPPPISPYFKHQAQMPFPKFSQGPPLPIPQNFNQPKIPFINPNQNNPKLLNIGQHSQLFNSFDSFDSESDYEMSPFMNRYGKSKPFNLSGPSENDPVAPDSKTEYFEKLKDYRMTMSEDNMVFLNFSINEHVNANAQTLKRINAEMKTLSKSVPCDSTASIFVMFDSECNHKVKFLLSGTVDTPYAHGLYLFDVLLPSNYPAVPPKVNLTTTGGGKFRFNPNLYDTGYVCLSIIGTWAGNPEEQWNPASSTLLQVMLSIQSLVMDNDIIQKEPSFHGVPRDSIENLGYQLEVKYGNLKFAMIEHLKNPPKGFETIIIEHFKIKKQEILKTASVWVQEAHNFKHRNYHSMQNSYISHTLLSKGPGLAFQEAYNELQNLLSRLN
ncbi:hypothetical protein SteCoe_1342 [Stentor coeruleus]|uniref:UBC core domain-containing protein n=1 Tax=Stentor coeruleus TaxID=5963 RepID=A0A1R2D203_9CILI|nr:hypothetical protein SteCoe_1342 [Stentor coeruleus]